jgi:prevent-host-death family protein
MSTTVTLKQIREHLSELVSRVAFGDQNVVITRFGKPVAALITYQEYEQLMNPRKRFAQEDWEKGFALIDKVRNRTKKHAVKHVEDAIDAAVADIRQKKRV